MQLKIAKLKNLDRSPFSAREKIVPIKSLLNLLTVVLSFDCVLLLLLVSEQRMETTQLVKGADFLSKI